MDGSGEPVQFGDGEGVAVADGGQCLVQAGPGAAGAGQPLVQVDAIGREAERGELLALGGEVLTGGLKPAGSPPLAGCVYQGVRVSVSVYSPARSASTRTWS
jgi:hypothetical protein